MSWDSFLADVRFTKIGALADFPLDLQVLEKLAGQMERQWPFLPTVLWSLWQETREFHFFLVGKDRPRSTIVNRCIWDDEGLGII